MATKVSNLKIWDRQVTDTDRSYEIFEHYRDLGEGRSLKRSAEHFEIRTENLERWSKKHNWVVRVRAFDRHIRETKKQNDRVEKGNRQLEMVRRHGDMSRFIQAKVIERVNSMTPEQWNKVPFGQLVSAYRDAVAIERLSVGLPTESVEIITPEMQHEQDLTEAQLFLEELEHDPVFSKLSEERRVKLVCEEFGLQPLELGYGELELEDGLVGEDDEAAENESKSEETPE